MTGRVTRTGTYLTETGVESGTVSYTTADLMDHLQEQGYEPQDTTSADGEWYDLVVSGIGSVRVCLFPDDGYSARIVGFDGTMACEWDVRTSPGTPGAVIIGIIEAAEWEPAARRGGPVTPAQVQARNA
jgi:hypothetical protein